MIRKARLKDIKVIVELAKKLLNYHANFDEYMEADPKAGPTYFKWFRSAIYSSKKLLLVAELDGKLVGYALGVVTPRPPVMKVKTCGKIFDVFVLEEYRRSGVAGLFIKELLKWFRSKKLYDVELFVHVKNALGVKAWTKYGFNEFISYRRISIK